MSIKIENIKVNNFEDAIRGMRNPMNSWNLSDSTFGISRIDDCEALDRGVQKWIRSDKKEFEDWSQEYENRYKLIEDWLLLNGIMITKDNLLEYALIGPNDLKLCQRLLAGGSDDYKFMRQITVSMDITAPLYWWKEFDTYKVGTVANSCSTMHKIQAKEFTLDDFSHEHLKDYNGFKENSENVALFKEVLKSNIKALNIARKLYLQTNDKQYWWQMIQLLPTSYNQKRTVTLNYQVLRAMYFARKSHKLDEWREFCKTIEKMPYAKQLICYKKEKKSDKLDNKIVDYLIDNNITDFRDFKDKLKENN